MCKLGVISQERLKIEVKLLLLSANGKTFTLSQLEQQRMTLILTAGCYANSSNISKRVIIFAAYKQKRRETTKYHIRLYYYKCTT